MFGIVPFGRRGMGVSRRGRDLFDIDSFFDDFFDDRFFPAFYGGNQIKVDIRENDKEYILEADIPGVDKENITVEVNGDVLTISAKWDEQTEIKKENYLRRERRASSMSRSFTLENVDSDRITAKHENGVLTLILPKKEPRSRGRRINIS
ncbi:MAG TPA: Hsp20/alpha crystallin family protein [Hungateiclostridium thermocellum]|jgi:HSP20 family protein|uniref:Heat-shock protein Hsp20 n=3 Tax=Acetivibrio TaxID=35829 RepID=A0A2S8R6X0_9FIRM|nr:MULTISPECIES: Hsp20/alpha crystallin family protein [Acetivibrio]CDG37606.1 heat shock protein Hsp20 [Acetivibrio thermocellus BC1]ABN54320.1 heat shock protein Hsp20 [Acetivibrio thermocellus ATCC 27405]ADU73758.1 heat shock protein Hsp20 [Acetivibrio thermocellus DSM 1313]ALX07688.1 heat shock protein Hsp20 [Acetivibrio thermocellus AD2]ANV75430.1 heat shock protein Hsp20 [Acetivibrio thermocellus DSM 2360]